MIRPPRTPCGARGAVAIALCLCLSAAQPQQPAEESSLTTADVLKMLQGGVSEDLVIAAVKKHGKAILLTADDILLLKSSGATDGLVKLMMNPELEAKPGTPPTEPKRAPPQVIPAPPATPAIQPPAPRPPLVTPPAQRPVYTTSSSRGAPTRPGAVELTACGGFNNGIPLISRDIAQGIALAGGRSITIHEGAKVKWLAGGSLGFAVTRGLLVVGESVYNRVGNPKFSFRPPGSLALVENGVILAMWDFTGGIQYQLPVPTSRVVPYLSGGAGLAHFRASTDLTGLSGRGVSSGITTTSNEFTGHAGFGIRLYITERFGVRPEARAVFLGEQILGKKSYFRGALGIFYQFGG